MTHYEIAKGITGRIMSSAQEGYVHIMLCCAKIFWFFCWGFNLIWNFEKALDVSEVKPGWSVPWIHVVELQAVWHSSPSLKQQRKAGFIFSFSSEDLLALCLLSNKISNTQDRPSLQQCLNWASGVFAYCSLYLAIQFGCKEDESHMSCVEVLQARHKFVWFQRWCHFICLFNN